MKNDSNDRIIYSINVEDIQTVAIEEIRRQLTTDEIKKVERKIGDYIDWHGAIEMTIDDLDIKQIHNPKEAV